MQYVCDLSTMVPITVSWTSTAPSAVAWYATALGTQSSSPTPTMIYEAAVAKRVEYVDGFVGTGPWTTTTTTSRTYYGSSGGGSSSNRKGTSASVSLSKKAPKIIIGVAIPAVLAVFGALVLCCKKRKNKTPNTEAGVPAMNTYNAATPVAPVSQPPPSYPANQPNTYPYKQDTSHEVHEIGTDIGAVRAARVAALDKPSVLTDEELARRSQMAALEQEQSRIQAEMDRLRNSRT